MKILVSNLGSTSFKYRLFEITDEKAELLTQGGFERVTDYGQCIETCLSDLQSAGHIQSVDDLDGVGFKTVLGKDLSGCVAADETALAALEGFADVAPAHNPAYAAGIKLFSEKMPTVPLVALFETAFYQWIPEAATFYAIPKEWRDLGIRRYGFHGASHKHVAERSAELLEREDIASATRNLYSKGHTAAGAEKPFRVISAHLGGSSSVTGILNGAAIGTSMGFSPQSGLPQNNRVGDLDSMAFHYAMEKLNISADEARRQLNKESGLLGLSEVSNDLRDIREKAEGGNADAKNAIDVLVHSIRHWIGAFYFQMGGADAIVFTAGIGENSDFLRAAVCEGLEGLGIKIDTAKNAECRGTESFINTEDSKTKIIIIPANEELVVARETYRFLKNKAS